MGTEKAPSKRSVTLASKVMLLAASNPKKKPSMSYDRFEILIAQCKDGATPTVEQLLKAGYRMDDVRHDSAHGFIALGDEAIAGAAEQKKLERAAAIEAARKLLEEVEQEEVEETE